MEQISTNTQYGDFVGQAAADTHDSINAYLKSKALIDDSEFVIAIEIYSGQDGSPSISAVVAPVAKYDLVPSWLAENEDPLPARKVQLNVSMDQFFKLFDRFSVVIAPKGLDVIGRYVRD